MKQLLNDLKSMHEAAREEYEKSKKRPLGLDEHKVLQASWEMLDEILGGAEEAVEKQIPKKPRKENEESLFCPTCDCFLCFESVCRERKFNKPHCSCCGQAIDWGE